MPLPSSVMQQMMATFRKLLQPIKKLRVSLKWHSAFPTGAKIYSSEKYFGVRCTFSGRAHGHHRLQSKLSELLLLIIL